MSSQVLPNSIQGQKTLDLFTVTTNQTTDTQTWSPWEETTGRRPLGGGTSTGGRYVHWEETTGGRYVHWVTRLVIQWLRTVKSFTNGPLFPGIKLTKYIRIERYFAFLKNIISYTKRTNKD